MGRERGRNATPTTEHHFLDLHLNQWQRGSLYSLNSSGWRRRRAMILIELAALTGVAAYLLSIIVPLLVVLMTGTGRSNDASEPPT
jgi:hypothetical protein